MFGPSLELYMAMRRSSLLVFIVISSLISSQSFAMAGGGGRHRKGNRSSQKRQKAKQAKRAQQPKARGQKSGGQMTRLGRLANAQPKTSTPSSTAAKKTSKNSQTRAAQASARPNQSARPARQRRGLARIFRKRGDRAPRAPKAPRTIRATIFGYASSLLGLATAGSLLADMRSGFTARFSEVGETFFQNSPSMMAAGAAVAAVSFVVGRIALRRTALKSGEQGRNAASQSGLAEAIAAGLVPQGPAKGLPKIRRMLGIAAYTVAAVTVAAVGSEVGLQWTRVFTGGESLLQSYPAQIGVGAVAIIGASMSLAGWAIPEGHGTVPGIAGESGFDGGGGE